MHAANILWRSFAPDQNAGLTARGGSLCLACRKHNPPGGRTGAGSDPAANHIPLGTRVNLAVQQLCQGARFHPHQSFLARNDPFIRQGHGNFDRRPRRARHHNTVQNMQFAVFNHEFDLHFGA